MNHYQALSLRHIKSSLPKIYLTLINYTVFAIIIIIIITTY
jgi:hypothetical protein